MLRNEHFILARLLLAALAAAVAGCSGDGMTDDVEGGREGAGNVPVAFVAAVSPQPDSRAATNVDVTTDNITSMGVYADYTWQSNITNYTSQPNFMKNERITCTHAGGVATWTYSPVKYWPNKAGDKITFCVYSPHQDDLVTTSGGSIIINDMETIVYTAPTNEVHQVDLLASNLQNATKRTALRFYMKHILTKVEVKIKASMEVVVTGLQLKDAVKVATFNWKTLISWTSNPDDASTLGDFTATLGAGGSTSVPATTASTQPTVLACFYLPPFTPPDARFTLKYKETESSAVIEKDIALPYSDVSWGMGTHLIYTIIIDKTKLSVKASTADSNGKWDGDEVAWGGGSL